MSGVGYVQPLPLRVLELKADAQPAQGPLLLAVHVLCAGGERYAAGGVMADAALGGLRPPVPGCETTAELYCPCGTPAPLSCLRDAAAGRKGRTIFEGCLCKLPRYRRHLGRVLLMMAGYRC